MAKNKGKNNFDNKNKSSRDSFGSWQSKLGNSGFSVPENKEEQAEDKYKDYDPDKEKRGKNRQRNNGQSSWNGGGNKNNRSWNQSGQNSRYGQKSSSGKSGYHMSNAKSLPLSEGPYSPYNFVPMSDRVLEDPADARLNVISDDLYSGELCYSVTAQTPILVDSGNGSFYQSKNGKYALPGSTIRGLIRSNLQILSFAGFRDDIDDYKLMYRAVAGSALKDYYEGILGQKPEENHGHQMTVLKNVKAGYLKRSGEKYTLYHNIVDRDENFSDGLSESGTTNYYVVSERYVIEKAQDKFDYILDKMQYKPDTIFVKEDRADGIHYVGSRDKEDINGRYVPYYEEISYALNNGRVTGIKKEGLKEKGYVISTGFMGEKKAFYVIPEIDEANPVDVLDEKIKEAVKSFQVDYNRKKNGLKDRKGNFIKFFDLPEDGETRPVFYIEQGGRLYFGYTPRLRLMFDYTILDGLKQKDDEITDFSKNMFGYSKQNGISHKSRLFFTDAILSGSATFLQPKNLILAEPKPTSYLEYLCQDDGKPVKTYNDKDFRLRGTKQYWLQNKVNDGLASNKEKVKSSIKPMKDGCTFKGKIRFQNLTATELGLLIWSVKLEKDCQMNVGKAKAYGYGRIKIHDVELQMQNHSASYNPGLSSLAEISTERISEEERNEFEDMYKIFLADWLMGEKHNPVSKSKHGALIYDNKHRNWAQKTLSENSRLSDFFYMKTYIASDERTQYMPLEKRQGIRNYVKFKQKNNPLPTVLDYRREKKNSNR